MEQLVNKICVVCGKRVRRPSSHSHAKKACEWCGKMMEKLLRFCSQKEWDQKKYCSRSCVASSHLTGRKGESNFGWKGGRMKRKDGYIYVRLPNHPNASVGGYFFEHRHVMEQHLGRYLERSERVHHINGIKDDNRLENLQLFSSESEHQRFHLDNNWHSFKKLK